MCMVSSIELGAMGGSVVVVSPHFVPPFFSGTRKLGSKLGYLGSALM